jgi:hypothetical protein
MWRLRGNPLLTMGFDGYTGVNSNAVVNITETAEHLTAFKNCIDPGEKSEDGAFLANTLMEEMKLVEKESPPRRVEDVYVGTVGDNVSCNRSAAKAIEKVYPKLLHPGCCTHVCDLLIEDICEKIPEIKELVKDIRDVAVFVKSHRLVKAAYKRISQQVNPKGTMLPLFPQTRFSYADLTLQKFVRNDHVLRSLIDETKFKAETCHGINVAKVDAFTTICNSPSKAEKVRALRHITGPLCKMIHHLEQNRTRASWIFPLFTALQKDCEVWKERNEVIRWFRPATIGFVSQKIKHRWHGYGQNIVPLKNDIWLVAFIFDPYYTPNSLERDTTLGIDWMKSVRRLLAKFYHSWELENAMQEVYELVLLKGHWGDEIKMRRETIKPPEDMEFSSHIDKVIWQQNQMISVLSVWELFGANQFTLCANLAIRLSVLAVQSANVERVCKAHGVIHTKTRNRLVNKSVQRLLFCYVNLRLLRKETSPVAQFLLSAIDDELDEVELDEGGELDNQEEEDGKDSSSNSLD